MASEQTSRSQIIHFENKDGLNYILMSRIRGKIACSLDLLENPNNLVKLLAEGLKMLWKKVGVDIND